MNGSSLRVGLMFAAVLVTPVMLAGCGESVSAGQLVDTEWELLELNGKDVLDDVSVRLELHGEDELSGTGGCNLFAGSWSRDDRSEITFDVGLATLMACDETVMGQEAAFMEALTAARTFDLVDDRLWLINADGREVAEFARLRPASLTRTEWQVVALNDGANQLASVLEEAVPTALFDTDERLSGHAGCNSYMTSFSRDGDSISIEPAALTQMACDQPIMEQEARFMEALEQAATYELGHETLYLRAENGAILVWFRDID